jgi:hypothetical protein
MGRPGNDQRDDKPLREAALERLVADLANRRARAQLRPGEVRAAAAGLGVGKRTLWRWIAAGRPPERQRSNPRRLALTRELRDAYLRLGGNVAAVWREARERGTAPPPLRMLQAAFARELSPAERASARRGEAGRREHGLYLRYEAPHRNAVWQADHKQLPVLVVAPGGRRGRRPWVTLFLDDFSRAITGWAISLQPTSAEVLAALRDALLIDPERGPIGGVPLRLRWDHGLEFAAAAVEQAALALGIDVDPATPYAPHEKALVSLCTSWGRLGGFSLVERPALLSDEPGVAGGGRFEEPFVLVVGLVAGEQSGGAPALDRGGVDGEPLGDVVGGEQAAGAESVGVAGELVVAA